MDCEGDEIALAVLDEFEKLPAKRKPVVRDNGVREWVPLSGIVARGNGFTRCLALATGMKCLPASRVPQAAGVGLHDWHAEVLAIRSFNHFILQECMHLASEGGTSDFLRKRREEERVSEDGGWHEQPFAWKDGVTLHMYCSEAPCGDASMELTMAAQDDDSPWAVPVPTAAILDNTSGASLPGRAYFSQLGVVRRKPARGDAPPTLSKSCSDKLALAQCTSLLSSLTSLLVSPTGVYLRSLVLPESQYSEVACTRAFSAKGRMHPVADRRWSGGYAFTPFPVQAATQEFAFSRRAASSHGQKMAASNLAVAWTSNGLEEALIGGVMQGRKQFDVRGASRVSRRNMWIFAQEIASIDSLDAEVIALYLSQDTYEEVKAGHLLQSRRHLKDSVRTTALQGWVRNEGDTVFFRATGRP